jgi:hypothetical protein
MIAFPDGTTRKLHDPWRWRLEEAELRYQAVKNKESRAECLRILRIFSALMLRYKLPEEYPLLPPGMGYS